MHRRRTGRNDDPAIDNTAGRNSRAWRYDAAILARKTLPNMGKLVSSLSCVAWEGSENWWEICRNEEHRERIILIFEPLLGAKRWRSAIWSRQDIVICHRSSLNYKHVHCPCDTCGNAAVSTSLEYAHWKKRETCTCINGTDPEPWLAKVITVDASHRIAKVLYYIKSGKREDSGMKINIYTQERNSRIAYNKVSWNSKIRLAAGEWNNATWERPLRLILGTANARHIYSLLWKAYRKEDTDS